MLSCNATASGKHRSGSLGNQAAHLTAGIGSVGVAHLHRGGVAADAGYSQAQVREGLRQHRTKGPGSARRVPAVGRKSAGHSPGRQTARRLTSVKVSPWSMNRTRNVQEP